MTFKDHFSRQAAAYSAFRPSYPATLYQILAGLCPEHRLACDCATGNGQAAIGLASYFQQVVAFDASLRQLDGRRPAKNIRYLAAQAEQLPLKTGSTDLLAVAQAMHWFELPAFYAEARRVLRPGGIIAAWTYASSSVSSSIDVLQRRFHTEVLGPYWPKERRLIEERYQNIPFPFQEIAIRPVIMECQWTMDQYLGYLSTWSAVQCYMEWHDEDPIEIIVEPLSRIWGEPGSKRRVSWPVTVRVGRI